MSTIRLHLTEIWGGRDPMPPITDPDWEVFALVGLSNVNDADLHYLIKSGAADV